MSNQKWTDEHDDILLRHYSISGPVGVSLFVPFPPLRVRYRAAWLKKTKYANDPKCRALLTAPDDQWEAFHVVEYEHVPYHLRISNRTQYYPELSNQTEFELHLATG